MHPLHSSVARRGIGAHFVRVVTFSAALTTITTIVVADVVAAEPAEPTAMGLREHDAEERGAELLAVHVQVPDALVPVAVVTPELEVVPEPAPAPKQRKARKKKIAFGRFEGY